MSVSLTDLVALQCFFLNLGNKDLRYLPIHLISVILRDAVVVKVLFSSLVISEDNEWLSK